MKRKNERSLTRMLMIRVVALCAVLLVVTVLYGFFLIRYNGYSNAQNISLEESGIAAMLLENLTYDVEAVSGEYASDKTVQELLAGGGASPSDLIVKAYHLIADNKPTFLTHRYFHSFCLVDLEGTSYFSFNTFGMSFLQDFETLALKGEPIGEFEGYTDVYLFNSTNSIQPFYLLSYVRDVYGLQENGKRKCLGKVIININFGEFSKALLKSNSYFEGAGLINEQRATLYLYPQGDSDITYRNTVGKTFFGTKTGFCYIVGSQDKALRLALIKPHTSFIQYTDAYIVIFLGIMVFVIMAVLMIILLPMMTYISGQIKELEKAFRVIGDNHLDLRLDLGGAEEFVNISDGFNEMTARIKENTDRLLLQERQQQELNFELMIARINPHFVYNTLNSVIYLARKNRDEDIIRVTAAFITLLQDITYFGDDQVWTTVEAEIDAVERYQLIQKYRYGDVVTFRNDCEERVKAERLPANLVIPLIENALLHGICEADKDGTIILKIRGAEEKLVISVSDDGIGMTEEAVQKLLDQENREMRNRQGLHSIGLYNINERLTFLYEGHHRMKIESKPGEGTTVTIILPLRREEM